MPLLWRCLCFEGLSPSATNRVKATQERPLRVVYCLAALNYGGSELATIELATGLREAGHEVTLIAGDGPLLGRCRQAGIECLLWPIGRKRLSTLVFIWRLRRWLRTRQVDILHIQARLPGWIAYLAWRGLPRSNRPHWVSTMHGHYSINAYSRIMTRGERVIAVSQAIHHWAERMNPQCADRLRVIYGGIDSDRYRYGFRPDPLWLRDFNAAHPHIPQQPVITMVARGTRLKNHAGLIRLIAALREQGEDVAGMIVGGFSKRREHYKLELDELAAELGVHRHIHYLGDRDDVREVIAVSRMVLNLSNKPEAFGRTLVEALALGIPVLAWDQGGASEILAAVFPLGAAPAGDEAALVKRARELLHQRPVVSDVMPFKLEQTTLDTIELYQELLTN